MQIQIFDTAEDMGKHAAAEGADCLRDALGDRGSANIIVATGASQFEVLDALVKVPGIDWSRITGFHLDEYIGLPISHPASFRNYLKQRFVDRVDLGGFHYVDGEAEDAEAECERLGQLIAAAPVDVAFIGIGENGHLAFNDPPADFKTERAYLVVELDEACRRQQVGEGWFPTLNAVPQRAISMSVRQILKAQTIMCSVPDERKAEAVRQAVTGPVSPDVPASILQEHPDVRLFLDRAAASHLE